MPVGTWGRVALGATDASASAAGSWSRRTRWSTVRWCRSTGRRINGTVNDDVFVGDGRLVIRGEVTGDVLVVHGDVLITGRVDGDVVALDGRITTRDGAQVNGDVKSRQEPDVAPGTVRGDVKTLNIRNLFAGFLIVFLIYLWIAVTVSVAILGLLFVLLFPRAADATAAAGRRFWPTLGWGALIGIVGPILGRAGARHHRRDPVRARDPLGAQRARAARLRRELAHPRAPAW